MLSIPSNFDEGKVGRSLTRFSLSLSFFLFLFLAGEGEGESVARSSRIFTRTMDACRDLYLWDELVPVLERCVVSKRAFLGRETVKGSGHESLCTVFNFGNLTFNQFQRWKE